MTRYVDKKHGLTIGSDNCFAIVGDMESPEGVEQFRDGYMAIAWGRMYSFKQNHTANVLIETPVNQILWKQVKVMVRDEEFEDAPRERIRFELKSWANAWLTANVGPIRDKWDVRTYPPRNERYVFFKRRKDALAFVAMIEGALEGMEFL